VFPEDAKVLDVALGDPASLDPMRLSDPASELVARQLYEGLVDWDPVKKKVVAGAATSWKMSKGFRRFTFRLRKGMKFHDGAPVRAQDFVFAFDRIAKKKNASDLAYLLDEVKGFNRVNTFGKSAHLTGLKAAGPYKLVITLSRPDVEFPTVLTHPALVPLEAKAVKHVDRFLRSPVGNGPFRMAGPWTPAQPVNLEAFRGYFAPPSIDGIRFLPYASAGLSWADFVHGDLDVSEVPVDQVRDARDNYGTRGFKPFLAADYYSFNLDRRQLRNKKLRVAINHAIDRRAIARGIYKGSLTRPRGIVPKGIPGFDRDACGRLCRYDPTSARHTVHRLSKKDRSLTLETNSGQPYVKVAKAIAEDLDAVGFKVTTKPYPFKKYLKLIRDDKQHVFRVGWLAEYPDPNAFLSELFSTRSPDNHSGFGSNEVDSLLARARRTRNDLKRLALYRKAEDDILEAVPVVPLGSFVTHWAAQPWVKGIEFDALGGFNASSITIEDH
jgi:peptide/nickel transport system substrate-binding protein/oligopeptide transport system substrate-binding protein